jgi:periplasmic divalent cation tolerance protein
VSTGYSIVITTTNSRESAQKIIAAVMEQKLAACVQVFPVVSHYVWKGELQKDEELRLEMKMRTEDYAALEALIKSVHPYETPEIVRVEIAEGSEGYLRWVREVTAL